MQAEIKKKDSNNFFSKDFLYILALLTKIYRTHHAQGLKHSLSLLFLIV